VGFFVKSAAAFFRPDGTETVLYFLMRLHRFIALAIGAAALAACESTTTPTLAALGGTASASGSTNAPLVISPNTVRLAVNGSTQLTTNAPFALQNQLQWSSLQTTVAETSPTGLVTAVGVGSATITVRYTSDTTNVATATVTVSAP
jgi:hypothetical protein